MTLPEQTWKKRIKLTTEEAKRVNQIADVTANRIVSGETLRLAKPIARLIHEKIIAMHKRIEEKYGEVV